MLNEWALEGRLEVTALSLATYPLVQDRYVLLPHGASIGSGYGPIVVAREPLSLERAARRGDRRPGALTTASSCCGMALGGDVRAPRAAVRPDPRRGQVRPRRRRPPDPRRPAHVRRGGAREGARPRRWWLLETGLPLPLGVNVARRDVPRHGELRPCCASRSAPGSSIATRRCATRSASRATSTRRRRPVHRDVRQRADLRLRRRGRKAVEELLRRAVELGVLRRGAAVEFVA